MRTPNLDRMAAEGQKWAVIMREVEKIRDTVMAQEIAKTKAALVGVKVPISSKVARIKEPTPVTMHCGRCNHEWDTIYDRAADEERMCPACRSNSVRILVEG